MCVQPIVKQRPTASSKTGKMSQLVPCGKCPQCVKARLSAWLFRLNKQLEISSTPLFCLLTYNDDNVPRTETGNLTLCKQHIKDFCNKLHLYYDRLQEKNGVSKEHRKKIKYFIVGEYGSKYGRPHYHAIILNCDAPELISKLWSHGFATTPALRPDSDSGVRYALKYISKPGSKQLDDREKEFSLKSNGIGANYLSDAVIRYHNADISHCFITLPGGVKMALPKYYKEKIYDTATRAAVTRYLSERSQQAEKAALYRLKIKNPNVDENILLRNLEMSKKEFNL